MAAYDYAANQEDDSVSLFSFGEEYMKEGDADVVSEVCDGFYEEVEAAQKLGILRNQASYVNGRMEQVAVTGSRAMTPEKVFNVPKLVKWTSGVPEGLLDEMVTKRVRTRLQADMGTGKSTKLLFMVAERLNKRVLVVGLDARVMRQSSDYVKTVGIGVFRSAWTKRPEARVCYMTYDDFNGHMQTERRLEIFRSFDVMIFDEAFEATFPVFCAKRAFTAFATPEISLILCSATISTDTVAADTGSARGGSFRVVDGAMSVDELIASGKLVGDYLTDRSYIVLPRDSDVQKLQAHYEDNGVSVMILDSASTDSDLHDVNREMRGDSVSPRVLVMHYGWAVGLNVEVEFGVIQPLRGFWKEIDGVWKESTAPMTEQYVMQACSRSGRGIGESSSGIVVGSERADPCDLYESDVTQAFFLLHAMYIKPGRNGRWEGCYKKYPDGIPPVVAYTIGQINIPSEIAVMFVASDGLIAKKYVRALTVFTQMDHFLMASEHEEPKALASWVMDDWVDESLGIESRRLVPVHAEGELQCVLHGIVAIAEGELELKRWRPQVRYSTGCDAEESVAGSAGTRLRRVQGKPLPAVPMLETELPDEGFRLDSPLIRNDGRRVARVMDRERMREALIALEKTLVTGTVVSPVLPSVDTASGEVTEVELVGDVNSPGGSLVCQLPAQICETMNEGRVMEPEVLLDLVVRTKRVAHEFVGSRVFDGFAGPWESYLRSVADPYSLALLRRKGEWTAAYYVVERMRSRFDFELVNVLVKSNVTRGFVDKLFRRQVPKPSALVAEIMNGRFRRFGQSDGFFERVKLIRSLLDRSLVAAEDHGLYLPHMVSDAQRSLGLGVESVVGAGQGQWGPLPIRGFPGVGVARSVDTSGREWRGARHAEVIDLGGQRARLEARLNRGTDVGRF